MVKKKQPDFQQTKLRVGKHLPKGRNVTNTSFKSKKIITKDQHFKTAKESTLGELLADAKSKNVTRKLTALKGVKSYVGKNASNLPTFFLEILREIHLHLLDNCQEVRSEAIELIKSCISLMTSQRMLCIAPMLASYVDCMMTHVDVHVRKDSLDLLYTILHCHPALICCCTKLLSNLLDMVSRGRQKSRSPNKRKLEDNVSNSMLSVWFRDQVFKMMSEFLEKIADAFVDKSKTNEEDQEVHWDTEGPLHLPLYAGGGLTPRKLDIYSPEQMISKVKVSEKLCEFFHDFVKVSSDIVVEETAPLKAYSGTSILKQENIKRLNTVTEALCFFADWYKLAAAEFIDDDMTENIALFMQKVVCSKLLKGFVYSIRESTTKKRETCDHLNLGVGYLYTCFVMGTEYGDLKRERAILTCISNILHPQFSDLKSLAFILKIVKDFIDSLATGNSKDNMEEISEILSILCKTIETSRNKEVSRELKTFFIDITLKIEYKFLLDCDGIKSWLSFAFRDLNRMMEEQRVDKKLLKFINLVTPRGIPAFSDILKNADLKKLLGYLKFEDKYWQHTIINLITSIEVLPSDFLPFAGQYFLQEQRLHPKTVVKFVRFLPTWVEDDMSDAELLEIMTFLINVGCDMASIQKTEKEGQKLRQLAKDLMVMATQGQGMLQEQLKLYERFSPDEDVYRLLSFSIESMYHIQILPHFREEHSEITEACWQSLCALPQGDTISHWIDKFFEEVMNTWTYMPVHSALALYKLASMYYNPDQKSHEVNFATSFVDEMTLSVLFYTSMLTDKIPSEKLPRLGIAELLKAVDLDSMKAVNVLNLIMSKLYTGISPNALMHVLRIMKYLYTKMFVDASVLHRVTPMLARFQQFCKPGTQEREILYDLFDIVQDFQMS